jgi:hypothetical protein
MTSRSFEFFVANGAKHRLALSICCLLLIAAALD